MSEIIITTHDALDNRHKGTMSRLHGKSVPYGFAGYVPQDKGFAVCCECALAHYESELKSDKGGLVYGNSEWDYPGAHCAECDTWLDTYLLVYQSQDPRLYWRLRMTEELGLGHLEDTCASIEDIAKEAKRQAYDMGYQEGTPMSDILSDDEIEDLDDDRHHMMTEPPTDSARWVNVIAPKLRALAGYDDAGHGTYQEVPIDVVPEIHSEDIMPAFRRGFADKVEGKDQADNLDL